MPRKKFYPKSERITFSLDQATAYRVREIADQEKALLQVVLNKLIETGLTVLEKEAEAQKK